MEKILTFVRGLVVEEMHKQERDDLGKDLLRLERILTRTRAMLNDAEHMVINQEAVWLWLRELKCIANDAEDVLDECHYELLRFQVEPKGAARDLPPSYASSSSFRWDMVTIPDGMSEKIEKISEQFVEISRDREALQLTMEDGEKRVATGFVNPLPTSHLVDKSYIFGRNNDKEKIVDHILSGLRGEEIEEPFKVIPIWGMGGLGKTTLAQMVYNDPNVQATFDVRGWVYVSLEFDVTRITKEISEFVIRRPGGGFDGFSMAQEELQKSLAGKRLLVVLDDVWNEQKTDWELLLLPLRSAEIVRVLVTTRNESVAQIVQTVSPYCLSFLPDHECWQLFQHCAFGDRVMEENSRFEQIGKQIVRKCGGLPLAVKSIGGLLHYKKEEDSWMEIMENELWEFEEHDKVLCALKVSYYYLAPKLRECFLFCSLFPKGSRLKKVEIIYMWIALGYIRGTKRAEDLAEEYLDELHMKSFILFDKKNSFVLHDAIYDLARSLSTREIQTIMDDKPRHISDEIRHLYVKNGVDACYSFNRVCRLRTFFNANQCDVGRIRVLGLMGSHVRKLDSSCCRLKHLRYLSIKKFDLERFPESICLLYNLEALRISYCSNLRELPFNLVNLVNLRYFHLSHAGIEALPETLCQLLNLQTLHIERCDNLRGLPENIGNLISLRFLRLKSCKRLMKLPSGIENLINLRITDVRGCSNLIGLPQNIGNRVTIQHDWLQIMPMPQELLIAEFQLDGDWGSIYSMQDPWTLHNGRMFSFSFENIEDNFSEGRNTWMSPYNQSDCNESNHSMSNGITSDNEEHIMGMRFDIMSKSCKIGQKPCKIISPNLNVGGELAKEASNRNTGICINGQRLGEEEMANLQNCPFPPGRIKGGEYWYDKISGYWGKMGQKPCKIISPNLHVGGELAKKASNGNTGICINGREITKSELKMLKWAGVQCAGKPQFWVNSDGSYLEEGQKKIIGHLWNKPIVKLLCPVLSLPTPGSSANPNPNFGEKRVDSVRKSAPYYAEQKSARKFLLVGSNGSGTSTIFKQAKFLYKTKPFSDPELQELKTMIQSSVYKYLAILLEGREIFEEEYLEEKMRDLQIHLSDPGPSNRSTAVSVPSSTPYSITSNSLRGFSDWLLKVMASGNLEAVFPAATREYAPRVEELWNDSGIQASFKRRDELEELPASAGYFLQRTGEICRADYEPSNNDILQAEGLTLSNGVASADIIFPHRPSDAAFASDDSERQETLLKYQLIRIQSKGLNANNKWLDLFDEVRIVIFCVSLTDYNQFSTDSTNKMIKSRDLFAKIVTHPNFEQTNFLLVLNKSDLLDEKLEKSPLSTCEWFSDFAPLISSNRTRNNHNNYNSRNNNSSLGQIATHYIGVKFKRYFSDLTSGTGKRLYVLSANSLDSNSVDFALRYAKEILNWEDEKPDFGNSDSVYTMTEPTEYSN